jgi:acyl-CoA synthetase (AMP-forming)/AMP-acid ligase II
MFDGYEGAWATNDAATLVRDGVRFHRTGDVGYLEDGVLFSLGRLAHVIDAAAGPIASVVVEAPVAAAVGDRVAAIKLGPAGAQLCAVVVERPARLHLAPAALAAEVRAAAPCPVSAVLTGRLPVDHRHQSKIDRVALAARVQRFVAGR